MSLKKHENIAMDKAKYEFMQELGIIPNERKQNNKLDTKKESVNISKKQS